MEINKTKKVENSKIVKETQGEKKSPSTTSFIDSKNCIKMFDYLSF